MSFVNRGIIIPMIFMFMIFVAVQYNDPDGWLWMLAYGYAATMGIGYLYKYQIAGPAWIGACFYLLLAINLIPRDLSHWLDVEEAREGFGSLICCTYCLFVGAMAKARKNPRKLTKFFDPVEDRCR